MGIEGAGVADAMAGAIDAGLVVGAGVRVVNADQ